MHDADASKTIPGPDPEGPRPRRNALRRLIERAGGSAMLIRKLTRVICSLLLVGLSIVTLLQRQAVPDTGASLRRIQHVELGVYVRPFPVHCKSDRPIVDSSN